MQKKLIFFGMNKRNFKKTIDKIPIMWYYRKVLTMQRDVAQFGRVLRSGRRGRRFKSCHPDHVAASLLACRIFLQKIRLRFTGCRSSFAKRHARLTYALASARTDGSLSLPPFCDLCLRHTCKLILLHFRYVL